MAAPPRLLGEAPPLRVEGPTAKVVGIWLLLGIIWIMLILLYCYPPLLSSSFLSLLPPRLPLRANGDVLVLSLLPTHRMILVAVLLRSGFLKWTSLSPVIFQGLRGTAKPFWQPTLASNMQRSEKLCIWQGPTTSPFLWTRTVMRAIAWRRGSRGTSDPSGATVPTTKLEFRYASMMISSKSSFP